MSDGSSRHSAEKTTIYDYWMALYRRRGIILLLMAVAAVSSLLLSSLIQPVYRSQASFFVLRSVSGPNQGAREFTAASPMVKIGIVHAFAEILNGRDAKMRILEDFPGVELEDLGNRPIVTATSAGMLNVTVDNPDPQLAADLANAFVAYFRKIVWAPSLNEGVQKRARIEADLAEVTRQLEQARLVRRQMNEDPSTTEASAELESLQAQKFNLDEQIREMELRLDSAKHEIDSLRLTALRERRTMLQSEVEGLEIKLKGFKNLRSKLTEQIRRATDKAADVEVQDAVITTLRLQQETLERTLDGLSIGTMQEKNVELVTQTATPSNKPVVPDPTYNLVVALIVSFIFGCMLSIYLETRETKLASQLERQRDFEAWAEPLLLSVRGAPEPDGAAF